MIRREQPMSQLVRINNSDNDYINCAVGDEYKLFYPANNSESRRLQLSYPVLEVWEIFPKNNKSQSYLENSKVDAVYYLANYVDINNIEVYGKPLDGRITRKSLHKICGVDSLIDEYLSGNTPIRILKLRDDSHETD